MNRLLVLLFLLVSLFATVLVSGCGGGGGKSIPATKITITGNVLWIETGAGTAPQTTVQINGVSGLAATADGYFSIDVPVGTLTLTATYAAAAGATPVVQTFNLGTVTASTDLGQLYIGPTTVSVTGRLLDSGSGAPVPLATVNFAGRTAMSGTDGRFTLTGVAYSSKTLSIFLGLQGSASLTNYFTSAFNLPAGATSGVADAGDITMVQTGGNTPPGLPFDLTITVLPASKGAGAAVTVLSGATIIRTGAADATGKVTFWLGQGTYTVRATQGAAVATTSVTITNQAVPISASLTFP